MITLFFNIKLSVKISIVAIHNNISSAIIYFTGENIAVNAIITPNRTIKLIVVVATFCPVIFCTVLFILCLIIIIRFIGMYIILNPNGINGIKYTINKTFCFINEYPYALNPLNIICLIISIKLNINRITLNILIHNGTFP